MRYLVLSAAVLAAMLGTAEAKSSRPRVSKPEPYLKIIEYKMPPLRPGTSIADLVAAGHYHWFNPAYLEGKTFKPWAKPAKPQAQPRTLKLLVINGWASRDLVMHRLGKYHLRNATIQDLLAFGAAHPDVQRQHHVIVLGTHVDAVTDVKEEIEKWTCKGEDCDEDCTETLGAAVDDAKKDGEVRKTCIYRESMTDDTTESLPYLYVTKSGKRRLGFTYEDDYWYGWAFLVVDDR